MTTELQDLKKKLRDQRKHTTTLESKNTSYQNMLNTVATNLGDLKDNVSKTLTSDTREQNSLDG